MISKLEIQNFKCFQQLKRFEFSNLNLLTGINGRGKSSLLQSILLISQSIEKFDRLKKLTLNGQLVELGNYSDIKNSDTPRGEDIILNFDFESFLQASIHLQENESDEMGALVSSFDVTVEDKQGFDKIQSVLSNFISEVKNQLEDNTYPGLDINVGQMAFNQFITKIHYVSADRLGPVKYVDKKSFQNSEFINVGSKGQSTINVLANNDLPLVNDKLYKGKDSKSVLQQTEEWLSYVLEGATIEIRGKDSSSRVLWMLINNKSNSYKYKPSNVGFGYSYVLPLIVSGLIAQPGEIIIIENPEAHLHPRAQSRITEFLARVASCGVQVFIESHSEHILNGLRVSALNPSIDIKHSELSIHYFNESFDSIRLTMDDKGKIPNWPDGFFDQQELDLAEIFKYSR